MNAIDRPAPPWQVDRWFNTSRPLSLEALRGKVIVLEAFHASNVLRTRPIAASGVVPEVLEDNRELHHPDSRAIQPRMIDATRVVHARRCGSDCNRRASRLETHRPLCSMVRNEANEGATASVVTRGWGVAPRTACPPGNSG